MKQPNRMEKEVRQDKKRRLKRRVVRVRAENVEVKPVTPENMQTLLELIMSGKAVPALLNKNTQEIHALVP